MRRFAALLAVVSALAGALSSPAPARAAACTINTTLRRFSVSEQVRCVEQRLTELKYTIINGPDTSFGLSTHNAVVAFQRSKALYADGVVGPRTAAALGIWAAPVAAPCAGIAVAKAKAPSSKQVVVVRNPAASRAVLDLIVDGKAVLCGVPARIGRSGLRPLARRVSGDGSTPSGVFPLGSMTTPGAATSFSFFGNGRNPGVAAGAWRQVQPTDCWDATPGDVAYNTLVSRRASACPGPDDEYLPRYGAVYSMAALIGANMGPKRSGDASGEVGRAAAIFLHRHAYDSLGNTKATSGCVSLNATNLAVVLKALRPGQSSFVIG